MKKLFSVIAQLIGILCLFLFINSLAAAHDKVVVIPLGGAEGDATQGDVIQGRTFSSKEGKGLSGTMPTQNLSDTTTAVSAGYYSANDLSTVDPDLVPENIPGGVTIFGVTGTLTQQHTINGDGTVTDNLSGLMWQQADDGNLYNWYEANGVYHASHNPGSTDACGSLNLGGHPIGSWRLPTKDELKGLVRCSNGTSTPLPDFTYCGSGYSPPTIDLQYSCRPDAYWSSSEYDAAGAWNVYFLSGATYWDPRGNHYYVWCVR